jgi:hypothetical protein
MEVDGRLLRQIESPSSTRQNFPIASRASFLCASSGIPWRTSIITTSATTRGDRPRRESNRFASVVAAPVK